MPNSSSKDDALEDVKFQVKQTTDIMRDNMVKVLERDVALNQLEDKSELLRDGSILFEKSSRKLKQKMWWKNAKFMTILGVCVVILIIIIAVIILH